MLSAGLSHLQEVPVLHDLADGQPSLQSLPHGVVHLDDLLQ